MIPCRITGAVTQLTGKEKPANAGFLATCRHHLERDGRVYTKVVQSVTAEELMRNIKGHTRKGSVYCTDAFRGYQSLRRYGKHHTISHTKAYVDKRTKSYINGIEGFWSYARHILCNYRGVSKYHFPMYLMEIE